MSGFTYPISGLAPATPPEPRRGEPVNPLVPVTLGPPIYPRAFADTPAHQSAARAPADLSVVPAETGVRLIYIFRDPESGETIRQYPTQSLVELGRAGARIDRQV